MNAAEVLRQEGKHGAYRLLYSHDGGFTRYCVEVHPDGRYACRLNEYLCFKRGTHERMARLHGVDLNGLESVPMTAEHDYLG